MAPCGSYRPAEEATGRWHDDYQERLDWIIENGLPVYIRGFRMVGGFLAMWVDIDEGVLPRAHADRRFDLHYSLGKLANYNQAGFTEEMVMEMVAELNKRYAGTNRILKIEWCGKGGSVNFHPDEPLILDPVVQFLFHYGGVDWKGAHISL